MKQIDYKSIVGKIERIHLLRRLFNQKTTHDSPLHFAQMPIMIYIKEHENCTQIDIAEKLKVSPACIATSTKRLQKSGFITKTVDSENLRCKKLSLTEKGKNILEKHLEECDTYDEMIFSNFTDKELKIASDFLDKLIHNMENALGEKHSNNDFYELNSLIMRLEKQKEE